MSTENQENTNVANATTVQKTADAVSAQQEITSVKKRRGRGITNDTRSTSRKKFHERDAKTNGLFLGHLENVEVQWATLGEDVKIPQFQGMAVPRLVFTFASNEKDVNDRKYVPQSYMPVESTVETIPGGKLEWKINNMFAFMKHVMDVYVLKGRPMTEDEMDLLCLPFEDFDEQMQFVPLEPEVIVNGYKILFENYVKYLNNDGKPYYLNATGGVIPIWIKLLRFAKVKGEWAAVVGNPKSSNFGDLGFPTFIGDGVIELWRKDVAPNLIIVTAKESIVFKEVATQSKAPNAGIPGMPVMPGSGIPMGGMNMGGFGGSPMTGGNDAAAFGGSPVNVSEGSAADDLPF